MNLMESIANVPDLAEKVKERVVGEGALVSHETMMELQKLMDVQGQDGRWNQNAYTAGMYNGMELMRATLEGRVAEYRDVPDEPEPKKPEPDVGTKPQKPAMVDVKTAMDIITEAMGEDAGQWRSYTDVLLSKAKKEAGPKEDKLTSGGKKK